MRTDLTTQEGLGTIRMTEVRASMGKKKQQIEVIVCKVAANAIESAMADMGLSQENTARRAGMTTRQLGRIIQNENCPSLKFAHALSVVLNKPINKLFEFRVVTRVAAEVVEAESEKARKQVKQVPQAAVEV